MCVTSFETLIVETLIVETLIFETLNVETMSVETTNNTQLKLMTSRFESKDFQKYDGKNNLNSCHVIHCSFTLLSNIYRSENRIEH